MSRKSRETILKRVREQKRREKAALKRERRLARKMAKNAPEEGEFEGEDVDELAPGEEIAPGEETVDEPIEKIFADATAEVGTES
jgi:hypothetical protein